MAGRWALSLTREHGSAAIAPLIAVALVMVMLAGLGDLASFFMARTRAQTAADAAALAAAAELIPGIGGDPVGQAGQLASANGGRLIGCRCRLGTSEAVVTVAVPVRFMLRGAKAVRDVKARARAEVLSRP